MRFRKAITIRLTKAVIAAMLAVTLLAITPVKAFARDHDGDRRGDWHDRRGYYNQDDQGDQGDQGYYNQGDQGDQDDQGDQGYYNQGYYNQEGQGYYGRGAEGRREYYKHLRHERWAHQRWLREHGHDYYAAPAPYIYFGTR